MSARAKDTCAACGCEITTNTDRYRKVVKLEREGIRTGYFGGGIHEWQRVETYSEYYCRECGEAMEGSICNGE